MRICLVTIVLIKAITQHSELSQTHTFHCSSSRGFCMEGVHFNKACCTHWKQLLSYFSTSHKSSWGIFLSLLKCYSHNHSWHTIETWQWMSPPSSLHGLIFLTQADVLLFWVLNQIASLLCDNTNCERWQTFLQIRSIAAFPTDSGLQFPIRLTCEMASQVQKAVLP